MNERENFIRARDNEADTLRLGVSWQVFRHYRVTERTKTNAHLYAPWHDPGLPRFKGGVQKYSGEWLIKDDNAGRGYAPLREEPDLFLKFAALAANDPGAEDMEGRIESTRKWIKTYGVLGLVLEDDSIHDQRSVREENLLLFWNEVHAAARCWKAFQAASGPVRALKNSYLPGNTVSEKRISAAELLSVQLGHRLQRECYPKLYYEALVVSGEPANVGISWGFRSLLGAMYLQLAWRIKSRQCSAPGCANVIGLHERSDKETCSRRCKQRRKDYRDREASR